MVSLFYSIVIEHRNQNGFGPVSSMKKSDFGNFDDLWIFGSLLTLQLLLLFLFVHDGIPSVADYNSTLMGVVVVVVVVVVIVVVADFTMG